MTDDIEQMVRADLHRRAEHMTPTGVMPVGDIMAAAERRTSRRTAARSMAAVVVLLLGLGALVAARSRDTVSTSTPAPVNWCVSGSCVSAAASGAERVVVITHDLVAGTTRILTHDSDGWREIETDLPTDLVPAVVEVHAGRWWVGGSVPSADGATARTPVVASSLDASAWQVQRLDWHGPPPAGFQFSASADFLAFSDRTTHVLATAAELVPDPSTYDQGREVCAVDVDVLRVGIDLCDGESVGVEVTPAVAEILAMRPLWGSSRSGPVVPVERAAEFLGWEVLSSNGDDLIAVVQRSNATVVSTSSDGVEWLDTGRLVCSDGSPARLEQPAPVRDGGAGFLAGYCGDVVTMWSDTTTSRPRSSAPIEEASTLAAFVVDEAGLVLDLIDSSGNTSRFVSTDGQSWSEVDDATGRALTITEEQIVVARDDRVDTIIRPDW